MKIYNTMAEIVTGSGEERKIDLNFNANSAAEAISLLLAHPSVQGFETAWFNIYEITTRSGIEIENAR